MLYEYKHSFGLENDGHFVIEHRIDLSEIEKNEGDWHFSYSKDSGFYGNKDFFGELTEKDVQNVLDWIDKWELKIDLVAYGHGADLKKLVKETIVEIKENYKKSQ